MTREEFNTKYKEFIEDRFSGLDFDIPAVTGFLDNIFDKTLTKIPGFEYAQIKLKFGKARFYSNLGDGYIGYLIEDYINTIISKEDKT